jgi:hypothetical protein
MAKHQTSEKSNGAESSKGLDQPRTNMLGEGLKLGKYHLSDLGLTMQGAAPLKAKKLSPEWKAEFDDWAGVGSFLQTMERAIPFQIGDWLNLGERRFGEEHAQALEATGWKVKTIVKYAKVCDLVPLSRRRSHPDLYFSHHAVVAVLTAKEQIHYLSVAAKEKLSVSELQQLVNEEVHGYAVTRWLLVGCKSQKDRNELEQRLQRQGRITEPIDKRRPKVPKELKPAA